MKLAKKMLASVIALALVAALALTAFAAASEIVMTANKAVVGETVTVTVSAKNMAGLESADLVFNYDEAALEFVSIEEFDGDAAPDLTEGDKFDTGSISWSMLYKKTAKEDSGLAVLTFKVLKAGNTDITVNVGSWDGTEAPANVTLTVVAEDPTTATTAPSTAPAETEAPSKAPVTDNKIPQTGEAGVAAIAGVMALAAVAFVATRKKDEE